jgi:long-subunit fatty acid transport protein
MLQNTKQQTGHLCSRQYTDLTGYALNDEQITVQYSLNKRPKDMWNFIVGSQYQLNKHWMLRAEYGFLGSRQQFIGGLQYRFGL